MGVLQPSELGVVKVGEGALFQGCRRLGRYGQDAFGVTGADLGDVPHQPDGAREEMACQPNQLGSIVSTSRETLDKGKAKDQAESCHGHDHDRIDTSAGGRGSESCAGTRQLRSMWNNRGPSDRRHE